MILDTSAILSVVFQEPGHERVLRALLDAEALAAGSPTLAETGIVLNARLGPAAAGLLERFLDEFGVQEIAFGEIHWREAVEAYRSYGKGVHRAQLNFGDCMTYATAILAADALLYVGEDFASTDVVSAL